MTDDAMLPDAAAEARPDASGQPPGGQSRVLERFDGDGEFGVFTVEHPDSQFRRSPCGTVRGWSIAR